MTADQGMQSRTFGILHLYVSKYVGKKRRIAHDTTLADLLFYSRKKRKKEMCMLKCIFCGSFFDPFYFDAGAGEAHVLTSYIVTYVRNKKRSLRENVYNNHKLDGHF